MYILARLLAALAIVAFACDTQAQSLGASAPVGYADYLVLLRTPSGGLTPAPTFDVLGVAQRSPELIARYGYVPDITRPLAQGTAGHEAHSLDSFGLTGVVPAGLGASFSLTAGVANERCNACHAHFMAATGGDYRIAERAIGEPATAITLIASVSGELGFGRPESGTVWTGSVGFPLALRIGSETGTRLVPFLTPAASLFSTSGAPAGEAETRGGRFLLGGGVALHNPKSAIGASVGFQYVFVARTDLQIGAGLSIGGR